MAFCKAHASPDCNECNQKRMLLLNVLQSMAESRSAKLCAKPGLALVGDLGDEVGAAECMGAAVVGHWFEEI